MNRSVFAYICSISTVLLVSLGIGCGPISADAVTVAASVAVGDDVVVGGVASQSSADGRFVVVTSTRSLTAGVGGGGIANVYLYDRSQGTMTLVSHSADDDTAGGDNDSIGTHVNTDGAYVLFRSQADNLVAGSAPSESRQCFVYEHATGRIVLASAIPGASGVGGDDDSTPAAISADGRFAAFQSSATNLVTGSDANSGNDIFLFDWQAGTSTLVTHANGDPTTTANGASSTFVDSMSADGGRIVFSSNATDLVSGFVDSNGASSDVFVYDHVSDTHELVSQFHSGALQGGNGGSGSAQISANGRHVLFFSGASDLLVDYEPGGASSQLYRHNLLTGTVRVVSHARTGLRDGSNGFASAATISEDGAYVAFSSLATDLIPGFLDRNNDFSTDVYTWRSATGKVTLLSHFEGNPSWGGDGVSEIPVMSADGSQVAFGSRATDLLPGFIDQNGFGRDVFHWQRSTDELSLVSHALGETVVGSTCGSFGPRLSPGGSTMIFSSCAGNLVADGATALRFLTNAFLAPLSSGSPVGQTLERVSKLGFSVRSATGNLESLAARQNTMSVDGAFVVFTSSATDLIPGQTGVQDSDAVYLYDRDRAMVSLVSHAVGNPAEVAGGSSRKPRLSGDGGYVVFESTASNLVAGFVDNNDSEPDLYLYETVTGTVSLVSHSTAGPAIGANGTGADGFPNQKPYAISGDGSFVSFTHSAGDLADGFVDQNAHHRDLFLFERATGIVTLVSHSVAGLLTGGLSRGSFEPQISSDSRYIAFTSESRDLIVGTNLDEENIYLFERASSSITLVSHVHDSPTTGVSRRAEDPQISDDGATVAFLSKDSDLIPDYVGGFRASVFLFDRASGSTTLVTHAHGLPSTATDADVAGFVLSAGGSHIAFPTRATDVVAGQTDPFVDDDVFLWERATNTSSLVSRRFGDPARTANAESRSPLVAPDGSFVVFQSLATDLIEGLEPSALDRIDVFFYDAASAEVTLISREPADALSAVGASVAAVSRDGAFVAFRSNSERLISRDLNQDEDVFLRGPDLDADLALQMTGTPDPAAPGATVTYTLDVSNGGPGASAQVSVRVTLPEGMILQGHSGTSWICEADVADVFCTLAPSILPGTTSPPLTLEAQALPFVGSITASGIVQAAVPDLAPANDAASATTMLTGTADLSVVATVDLGSTIPGTSLHYQITASNPSAITVSEAMVNDPFPASLACAWTSGATGGATGNTGAAGLLADVLTLPPGSTVSYAVACAVDPAATGTVSNIVSVGSAATDPDPSNNQVTLETVLTPRADLSLDKRANVATVDPGNELTYTLSVSNQGASTSTGGAVTDPLPAGLTFVSSTDGCTEAGGIVTCDFGALDPASTIDLRFVVMVGAGAGPTLHNTATVVGNEVDPVAGNNSDSVETTVMSAAPTVTEVGGLSGPGEGVLEDCESTQAEISELSVTFSEPMKDPAGDNAPEDVTNPANYRLVATGPDLAFTVVDCASPVDGDLVVAIDSVTYDDLSLTARVGVHGGRDLALGVYRLLVCGALEDLLGNALDGDADGTGGDDFRSDFRVAEPNAFANGDLDCSLDGWVGVSTSAQEIDHSTEDADDAAVSGSAQIVNLTASTDFSLGQCVEVGTRGGYSMTGRLRIDSDPGIEIDVSLTCEAFDAPACGGISLVVGQEILAIAGTGGAFVPFQSTGSLPATTASALCSVDLSTAAADDFDAFLDRLVLRTGVVFANGFESGDTSAW